MNDLKRLFVKIIKKSLSKKRIKTVVVYDRDELLDWVVDLLRKAKTKVCVVVQFS